jgi:hypothetical protein
MSNASSKLALVTIALLTAAAAAPLSASAQQLRPLQQPQPMQQMPQPQRPTQLAQQPQRAQQPLPLPQQAQPQQAQKVAPAKPYAAIAVTLPKPYVDAGFEAFRKQLGAIAARKDRGALARLVANDFFWMGEQGDKANKKKSGIDNFAAAIDLDAKEGSGWEGLTEAANETTLEAIPQRKGVMCAPASPSFDENALAQLAKATGTEEGEWGYPEKAGVEVRASAQPNAPVIDRLGMNLVRVLPDQPATNGAAQQQAPSTLRVVTPSGKTGFVPEDAISPLGNDQICYRNDAGAWKIVGYAGGDE